jgi:hypothetical protein
MILGWKVVGAGDVRLERFTLSIRGFIEHTLFSASHRFDCLL